MQSQNRGSLLFIYVIVNPVTQHQTRQIQYTLHTFHQVLIHKPYITEKAKPNFKHITLKQIYDDVQKVTHE